MTRRGKVLLGAGIFVALIVGLGVYARPLLLTGTGYAAHNACAVELLAERSAGSADSDLPANPLVPVLQTTVDAEAGLATSAVFGLFRQTAYFAPGLGCTLAESDPSLTAPAPLAARPDAEWPAGDRVDPTATSVDGAALDAVIDDAFAEDDPDGRSVGTRAIVVVSGGRIIAERYGDGFDATTPQLGWSMAKSVTNAMVGRLVMDGTLSVDDDALLPEWADDDRSGISVDDLLRMSSGLQWDETYSLGSVITEMLYLRPDMGAFAASQPLAHGVGDHQQYSSGTTNILCDVLSQRTGMGEDLAQELVFRPLGMSSAVLEPDAGGEPVCSSYLWATPRDWARFGLWFAQGGEWDGQQLLPTDWVDYSTTPVTIDSEDQGQAAHWWVNQQPDGSLELPSAPADTFWASGHDGQRVFIIPSADLVIVRQGFTPEIPGDELGYDELVGGTLAAINQVSVAQPVGGNRLTVADRRDGDSFVASDGVEYRVGMINTPERNECGNGEASARTYELLSDGFVVEAYADDGNGRTVARVTTGDGDLGVLLASEGLADDRYLDTFRSQYPPYAAELDQAFARARTSGAGLYGSCWADGSGSGS